MLYYVDDEGIRFVAILAHWILGCFLFIVLILHIFLIKAFKRKKYH